MLSRRQFFSRAGSMCGGCLTLGSMAPRMWSVAAAAAETAPVGRRLIVIELQGGNDGLNTVVPFADDAYYAARPTLGIKAADVLKLDDHLGLNPVMKAWKPLWDAGQLAIVENCGYPQPNRSHFESMDIWHAGQVGSPAPQGWLGRAADLSSTSDMCYIGDGAVPNALSRRQRTVAALEKLGDLRLRSDLTKTASSAAPDGTNDDLSSLIGTRLRDARELSSQLPSAPSTMVPYLGGNQNKVLGDRLGVVRTLIERDQPFNVFYTAFNGFDTHASQRGTHDNLLRQTAEAVSGFLEELRKKKLSEGVTVFLFSEFGRRVKENGSQGTDHGAAAPVFVLGDKVRGGLQGGVPDLANLDDGDVRYKIDFRDVYAGLLADWLAVDPTPVLGPRETPVKLFG